MYPCRQVSYHLGKDDSPEKKACMLLLLLSRFSRVQLCATPQTRLLRRRDSPGKNNGVGCHFLLQCMKVKSESEVAQSCPTQRPHGLQPTRLLCPWDSPGKSTGVGCHQRYKEQKRGSSLTPTACRTDSVAMFQDNGKFHFNFEVSL